MCTIYCEQSMLNFNYLNSIFFINGIHQPERDLSLEIKFTDGISLFNCL